MGGEEGIRKKTGGDKDIILHMLSHTKPSFKCVSACAYAHLSWCMCVLYMRSEDNLKKLILFHHMDLRDQTQVIWLSNMCLYLLHHVTRPFSFLCAESQSSSGWPRIHCVVQASLGFAATFLPQSPKC